MDLNIISNFAVAIGTLALAYYAFENIRNSDKHLKFLKKQTDLFLSQQQSDIQIKECSFDGNKLILTLYNSGNGEAYDIAVSSTFHVVKPLQWSKRWWSKGHLKIPVISEMRTKKYIIEIEGSGNSIFNFKTKDKNILNPGSLVVFPNDDEYSNSLPAGFKKIFRCELLFYLKIKKERFGETPDYDAKGIPFDELRTLLLNNNIEEISVVFNLLSKDKLQNVKIHGRISDFVIVLSNDETLEIANKRGKRGPYNLDKNEIKSRIKWEDYDLYVHGKYLEPDDDE
jgi:hypothetical protein